MSPMSIMTTHVFNARRNGTVDDIIVSTQSGWADMLQPLMVMLAIPGAAMGIYQLMICLRSRRNNDAPVQSQRAGDGNEHDPAPGTEVHAVDATNQVAVQSQSPISTVADASEDRRAAPDVPTRSSTED